MFNTTSFFYFFKKFDFNFINRKFNLTVLNIKFYYMGNCYQIDMNAVNMAEQSIESKLNQSQTDYSCNGKYNTEQIKWGLREDYYKVRGSESNDYILRSDYNRYYRGAFK